MQPCAEWTEMMGKPAGASLEPVQFVTYTIDDDLYGVDIMAVREIKGWTEIAPLPGQPDYMRGVLNLRGSIVPIVDLRCRFGQGLTTATSRHIIIIVQIGTKLMGLLADRVMDIVSVDAAQIKPVPREAQGERSSFLSGLLTIADDMIALVDLHNILEEQLAEDAAAA